MPQAKVDSDIIFDATKAQNGNGCVQVTIPAAIAEDLGIEIGDQILWKAEQGAGKAKIAAEFEELIEE